MEREREMGLAGGQEYAHCMNHYHCHYMRISDDIPALQQEQKIVMFRGRAKAEEIVSTVVTSLG
jgi:hypothetical protein